MNDRILPTERRGFPCRLARVLCLAALLALAHPARLSAQYVHFPDANLEDALSVALKVPVGNITTNEMLGLTSFNGSSWNIQDTTGLGAAKNLIELLLEGDPLTNTLDLAKLWKLNTLYIDGCQLSDVSFLSGLTNLVTLDASDNTITNADPFSDLVRLSYLGLNNDSLSDLSPLAGLTNLNTLEVYENLLTNIPPLPGLSNLATLELDSNPTLTNASNLAALTNLQNLSFDSDTGLTDISMLAGLTNLYYLDISYTGVADASPLISLVKLQNLQMNDCLVTNAFVLSNLTSLLDFCAEYIALTNADFVADLPALQNLDLGWNQLSDASFMTALSQVGYVELDGNLLTRLPSLTGLQYLTDLSLNDNQLTNIDGVTGATNLQELELEWNQLTTLPAMSDLTNLTSDLDLSGNPLTNLAGLAGLANLTSLEISQIGTLTNFDALGQLTALQFLTAESSGFSDLSSLSALTNLSGLWLDNDDVGDASPLDGLINLSDVSLGQNVLTSMDSFTNLPRLGYLNVSYNLIDFSPGSPADNDLQFLRNHGGYVYYEPQESPLPQFSITVQPVDQTVALGDTATFSVTVDSPGSPPQYQWQFQDAVMPGQTADTLVLPGVQTAQAGRYRVKLTDTTTGRHTYSRSAQLVVQGGGQPTAPDLTVTGLVGVSPNPVYAGTTLTVSYSVTNQGGTSCPASHTRIQVMPGSSSTSVVDAIHTTPIIAAGASFSEQVSFPIPAFVAAGSHTVYVELDYDQAAGQTTGNDTAQTSVGALAILPAPTLAQAAGDANMVFTAGGDAPWFVESTNTHNGAPAALQSGHIGYNQGSWLSATITGPGTLSFWWNVDPDTGDVLACSGTASDTQWEYYLFADVPDQWIYETIEVPSGPCTFYWTYGKNGSSSTHADAGWLDNVTFTSDLPVIDISPQQWEFPGQSFTITSSVSGGTPLAGFQWYFNGNPVPGGTINGYGPLTASYSNAGTYTLLVSNSYATVSNSAKVVVAPLFYQVTDLGTLWQGGDYSTYTCGLNNFNDVVGYCVTNNTEFGHAWVWSAGVMTDLGDPLGGGDSKAYAINDQGDIVGTARVRGTTNYDGILWHKTSGGYTVNDLGRAGWPFGFAQDINNAGDIAFSTTDGGSYGAGNRRACLWRQGVLTPLGGAIPVWTNAPSDAYGWSINSLGLIAGDSRYTFPGTNKYMSIAWTYNGSCRDNLQADYPLTNLPADLMVDSSSASYINDYGDVIGSCLRSDYDACMAAYLISGTNLSFLAEGWNSIPIGFNNHGDVILLVEFEDYPYFGFGLFCSTNAGLPAQFADGRPDYSDHASFDLNDLLPGGMADFVGLSQIEGCGINEAGSISGDGPVANGEQHAFLATRLPLAGNHAPVSTGALSLTNASSTLLFPISSLLAKATDADGDPLFLLTTTQPVSGAATLRRNAGSLIYQANGSTLPANDSFSCIITDYHGGFATNTVAIVNLPFGPAPQAEDLVLLNRTGSTTLIRFHGTPGQTWRIQSCDDLAGGTWTTFATAIAGPDGLIDANDVLGTNSSRFYRAVSP